MRSGTYAPWWERPQASLWTRVIRWGQENSDGCTHVPDFHLPCCYYHDYLYTYAKDINARPVTRREADRRLRECIQSRSPLRGDSLMAWWRWVGLRVFGWKAWRSHRREEATLRDTVQKLQARYEQVRASRKKDSVE